MIRKTLNQKEEEEREGGGEEKERGEREKKGGKKGWQESKDYNHTQLTRGGEEKERREGEKGRKEGKEKTTITPNSLVREDAWLLYSLKSVLLSNSS